MSEETLRHSWCDAEPHGLRDANRNYGERESQTDHREGRDGQRRNKGVGNDYSLKPTSTHAHGVKHRSRLGRLRIVDKQHNVVRLMSPTQQTTQRDVSADTGHPTKAGPVSASTARERNLPSDTRHYLECAHRNVSNIERLKPSRDQIKTEIGSFEMRRRKKHVSLEAYHTQSLKIL